MADRGKFVHCLEENKTQESLLVFTSVKSAFRITLSCHCCATWFSVAILLFGTNENELVNEKAPWVLMVSVKQDNYLLLPYNIPSQYPSCLFIENK